MVFFFYGFPNLMNHGFLFLRRLGRATSDSGIVWTARNGPRHSEVLIFHVAEFSLPFRREVDYKY